MPTHCIKDEAVHIPLKVSKGNILYSHLHLIRVDGRNALFQDFPGLNEENWVGKVTLWPKVSNLNESIIKINQTQIVNCLDPIFTNQKTSDCDVFLLLLQ